MSFKNNFKILIFVSIFLFFGIGVCSAGIFGYTWEGVGSPSDFQDQITGSLFTLSETADIQSMSAWIDFGQGTSKMKVGIYDSDGDLVAESIEYLNEAGNIDPAWYDFTFSSSIILEAGNYWLVIIADTEYVYVYKETGTTLKTYQATSTYNGLLSSYNGAVDTGDPRNIVIYATYRSPYFVIPTDFATSILAYAGDLFTDLNLIIILAVGLPLGFWVIRKIISLVRAR